MSGIYIHIPFCKQACHYCDFHFSTSSKKKPELVKALAKELLLRKDELKTEVETIYFGGGTPSLLSNEELNFLISEVYKNFNVAENAEITLEANPDDLTKQRIQELKNSKINRLSIGVQSFFEHDLKLMNRAHNKNEALSCIIEAKKYFDNISIDLIYGIPEMSNERWTKNLETALNLDVPHLSCYALTIEPKTALKKFIDKGIIPPIDEDLAKLHYDTLVEMTEKAGYDNYEFSNFGKPNFYSKNNTAYWESKAYLGIGPSAHSFDGKKRSWNIANNAKYIQQIEAGILPSIFEILSEKDRYNEYIMTGLRTKKGVLLAQIENVFGAHYVEYMLKQAESNIRDNFLNLDDKALTISREGKFLSDGIASDLFML